MSLRKKLLCLVLCTVIVSSLGVTAWAETITSVEGNNTSQAFVYAEYDDNSSTPVVYSVDIVWGDLKFAYSSSQGIWNPSSHTYSPSSSAGWNPISTTGNIIKITNHSNAAIRADLASIDTHNTIDATLSNSHIQLSSAEGTSYSAAPSDSVTVSLSGTIDSTQTEPVTVASISITITPQ